MSVLDVISTPLREGRPDQPHRRPRKAVFNPRPSVRGDNVDPGRVTLLAVFSIHAPP